MESFGFYLFFALYSDLILSNTFLAPLIVKRNQNRSGLRLKSGSISCKIRAVFMP